MNSSEENTNAATFHSGVNYSISVIESIVVALVSEEKVFDLLIFTRDGTSFAGTFCETENYIISGFFFYYSSSSDSSSPSPLSPSSSGLRILELGPMLVLET